MALFQQALQVANQATAEIQRDRNRKLQKEADSLSNPIPPPHFYKTLDSRKKQVPDPTDPYSVEGVRRGLKNLILPPGYSEEQLTTVGFGPEVVEYQKAVQAERDAINMSFSRTVKAMVDAVSQQLTGENLELRKAMDRAGITPATVARFEKVAKDAGEGKLEPEAITRAMSEINTLLEKTNLETKIAVNRQKTQADISAAQDARTAGLLSIVQRALGTPKNRAAPVASSNRVFNA